MSSKTAKPERTAPNAEGDFYVQEGTCLSCMVPESEAPELMGFSEKDGCYFSRQPQTPVEVDQAIKAVRFSCVEALRYAGDDEAILARLRALGCEHLCDDVAAADHPGNL